MERLRSTRFWESLLSANPDFAGFGIPFSEIRILCDIFLIPSQLNELEISFEQEMIYDGWKQLWLRENLPSDLSCLIPTFAKHITKLLANQFGPLTYIRPCFFFPLFIHFFYKNEISWKVKIFGKLGSYKELILSLSKIIILSRFILRKDWTELFLKETLQLPDFTSLHFS